MLAKGVRLRELSWEGAIFVTSPRSEKSVARETLRSPERHHPTPRADSIARTLLKPVLFLLIMTPMDRLASYRRQAMRRAVLTELGAEEGYAGRIPGFRGLLSTGRTKAETLAELEETLADWIDLALKRGIGLPALVDRPARVLNAA